MNIALCGGKTAGHIIPNLALVDDLRAYFNNIYYFGNRSNMEYALVKNYPVIFEHVNAVKFSRENLLKNIIIPFVLPKYVIETKKLLIKNQINIVFSKGGFISLPCVLAARFLKIPVICHESDYSLGLTNKITSLFSNLTMTSFWETKVRKNKLFIGMPLRKSIFSGNKHIIFNRHKIVTRKPILLVMGGSLGSQIINKNIYAILDKICANFFVIHITGNNKNVNLNGYISLRFVTDIENYLSAADVIVSRCGATSAFELMALNKKVLFIPLSKNVSRGDQIENARFFYNKNMANVLLEENLSPSSLYREIFNTYNMNILPFKYNKNTNKKMASIIYKTALDIDKK